MCILYPGHQRAELPPFCGRMIVIKIDSSWIYSSCQVGARIWILSCFIANVNTNIISGVLSHGNMTLKHAIEHVKRVGISLVSMKSPWDMGYYMVWSRYRKLSSIFSWLQTFCKMMGRWWKGRESVIRKCEAESKVAYIVVRGWNAERNLPL